MNVEHETKKDVYFWAYKTIPLPEVTRKRQNSECGPSKSKRASLTKSKSESLEEKLDEVEDCVMKLKEKHGANYSSEQLRTWAHLIQMQRHESFDTPPDKPFFRGQSAKNKKLGCSSTSPGKKINLRSQCIDQLQKWHQLLESGIVSKDEYDNLQKKIMSDIKDL